ncbi:unnamed protein product [Phyllotreta striolata]|uniref:Spaetzle domain-containing protein n=1 Tax=Phyllotreta striolata TaxID=444603 RepID=A0A9N9XQN8_PHYSR|nr:unnamed protein product [Phyllotreta striolata]
MRIAHCVRALIAVLGLTAVVIPVAFCNDAYFNRTDDFYDFFRHKRSARNKHKALHQHEGGVNAIENIRMTKKQHQNVHHPHHQQPDLHHWNTELHHSAINRTGECCPTVLEKVEPQGGSNQEGLYVELYQDFNYRQRFFELSCHPKYIDKPCDFINHRKYHSKCVQNYSYTYALVKNTDSNRTKHFPSFPMFPAHEHGGDTYTLDYIKVRSGCSCKVRKKKKKPTRTEDNS